MEISQIIVAFHSHEGVCRCDFLCVCVSKHDNLRTFEVRSCNSNIA